METTQNKIKAHGLNYDYYINQCEALLQELNKGKTSRISEEYIKEKLRKIESLLEDLK